MNEIARFLVDGYLAGLRRYAVFNGRSARGDLWTFLVAFALIYAVASGLDLLAALAWKNFFGFRLVVRLTHALPYCAVIARRMHDLDRRGWWMFWPPTALKALWEPGTAWPNRFGTEP